MLTSENKKIRVNRLSNRGFTIVELLVVIVVIGILAAISVVSYVGITQKAIAATLQSDLKNASTQLEIDKTTNGTYPDTKEAANGGKGLQSSLGTDFDYRYESRNDTYVLVATKSGISFYITSSTQTPALGDTPPTPSAVSFALAFGGPSEDYYKSIIKTDDGGYAVVGSANNLATHSNDAFIVKYDSSGQIFFTNFWGDGGNDQGNAIVQTSDGGYVIAGDAELYGDGPTGTFLVKYNDIGDLVWSHSWYDGTQSQSMTKTSDGGFIIAGSTNYKMYIAKYDNSGNQLWNKTWTSGWYTQGQSIIQTSDGGYAVTGDTSYSSLTDMFIVKYDSNGSFAWNKTWGGASSGMVYGNSIIQTSDGGYAVTGEDFSHGAGSSDMFIAKYDGSGNLVWNKNWGGTSADSGNSLIQASDGGLVVTGYTNSFGSGSSDIFIAKYDNTGVLLFDKTWGGVDSDTGDSIIQTNDNGYAVAGSTINAGLGGNDALIAKFNSGATMTDCPPTMCQDLTASDTIPAATDTVPTNTMSTSAVGTLVTTFTSLIPDFVDVEMVAPSF